MSLMLAEVEMHLPAAACGLEPTSAISPDMLPTEVSQVKKVEKVGRQRMDCILRQEQSTAPVNLSEGQRSSTCNTFFIKSLVESKLH